MELTTNQKTILANLADSAAAAGISDFSAILKPALLANKEAEIEAREAARKASHESIDQVANDDIAVIKAQIEALKSS